MQNTFEDAVYILNHGHSLDNKSYGIISVISGKGVLLLKSKHKMQDEGSDEISIIMP